MGECLRELDESSFWLRHIEDSRFIPAQRIAALRSETDELISIFVTILKRAKTR